MKATEFFVGALVCAESPSGICEVKEILSDYWIDTKGIRHDYERTEPFLLTTETLNKNFEYYEVFKMYNLVEDFYDIEIRKYSNMSWVFTFRNGEMNIPDTQIAGICFVHELQRAFLLCGINKKINI